MKLRKPWLVKSLCFIGFWLVRALLTTVTGKYWIWTRDYSPRGCGPRERYIYALWHEYLLVPTLCFSNSRVRLLISKHSDGLIVAEMCKHLRMGIARGSTNRGGAAAVRLLLRPSRYRFLAVTPDGPQGPRRRVNVGIIYLAAKLGWPIIAVGVGLRRPWRLRSWDRFAIPRPFQRAAMLTAEPMVIPADSTREQMEVLGRQLEDTLNALSERAETAAATGRRPRALAPLAAVVRRAAA